MLDAGYYFVATSLVSISTVPLRPLVGGYLGKNASFISYSVISTTAFGAILVASLRSALFNDLHAEAYNLNFF